MPNVQQPRRRKSTVDKFREMILFISDLSEDDLTFGMTKLNRLMFYSDFLHYANCGSSISGQEYQKLPHGPAPRQLLAKLNEMRDANEVVIRDRISFSQPQKKPIALRSASLNGFTPQEIDAIHSVVASFRKVNGDPIGGFPHQFFGWEFAEEGETIPYEVALVGRREPTPGEIEYARTLRAEAQRVVSQA